MTEKTTVTLDLTDLLDLVRMEESARGRVIKGASIRVRAVTPPSGDYDDPDPIVEISYEVEVKK